MIYLSGAMSCFANTVEANYPYEWRRNIKQKLTYHALFDPTKYFNYETMLHKSEKEIMNYELRKVKQSSVVLVNLYKCNKSDGTKFEIFHAYQNNIPILGFGTQEDYDELHPWIKEMFDRVELESDRDKAMAQICEYINKYY